MLSSFLHLQLLRNVFSLESPHPPLGRFTCSKNKTSLSMNHHTIAIHLHSPWRHFQTSQISLPVQLEHKNCTCGRKIKTCQVPHFMHSLEVLRIWKVILVLNGCYSFKRFKKITPSEALKVYMQCLQYKRSAMLIWKGWL